MISIKLKSFDSILIIKYVTIISDNIDKNIIKDKIIFL